MESTKHPKVAGVLALVALLGMSLPGLGGEAADAAANSAAAPAAQKPIEQLQELDEVWVHGKKLARRIADAENDFFDRYNRLNKKADFRISCGYFTLDKNSMVMRRDCIPAFAQSPPPARYSTSRLRGSCGSITQGWGGAGWGDCSIQQIAQSRVYVLDSPWQPRVMPVSAERRKEYATHVMKLIMLDDDLRAKGEDLARLYKEFDAARAEYVKLKVERARNFIPPKPKGHPRF